MDFPALPWLHLDLNIQNCSSHLHLEHDIVSLQLQLEQLHVKLEQEPHELVDQLDVDH